MNNSNGFRGRTYLCDGNRTERILKQSLVMPVRDMNSHTAMGWKQLILNPQQILILSSVDKNTDL